MKEDFNSEYEEEYDEEFVEDLEFIQAATLSELRKKILKKLEDGGTIEQNPFLDTTGDKPMWTQMILYYSYDEEDDNE